MTQVPLATPLTVVVVTYDSAQVLPSLLRSLQTALSQVPVAQVVVVDNASSDGSADVARQEMPGVTVVETGRNAGYAGGINAGLAVARPDSDVLVLNPDVRLEPTTVDRLREELTRPGTGIAVPRLVGDDGTRSPSLRRDPSVRTAWAEALLGGRVAGHLGLGEVVHEPWAYERAHAVDWATGAVMAVSAACRAAVGEWDESFFLYSEEVDYCRRARLAGFQVRYVPEATAHHTGGAYTEDPSLWSLVVANRVELFSRHHGIAATAAFRVGVALGEAVRAPRSPARRAGVRAALTPQTRGPRAVEASDDHGFLWFAAQDWWYHNQAHSDFQLMKAVAEDRTVLVVNSLGLRLPRKGVSTAPWRRILRKVRSTAKVVRRPVPGLPRFHVMTPVILPFYGDNAGARFSAWLVRQQVRVVARAVGLGPVPHIGATIPTAWPVVRPMRRSSLVYNRADLHSAFPEADGGWVAGLEDHLLRRSDTVLYVSRAMMAADADVVGARGVFLDHGVDLAHFTPDGPVSADLHEVPHPRVGFFGGFDDYVVDMGLLLRTARELPDHQMVLIGDATCSMDELTALPNVHWFGFRPYAEIPGFGRGFDVALMPWLDNDWIRFANPIKMKEYLALGLPTVSTTFPEVLRYEGPVQVARSPEEFIRLVREAAADPGDASARREAVLNASWAARAATLVQAAGSARAAGRR